MDGAIDFFAGFVSGTASIVVGQPFDTIKVRLQTDASYASASDCARTLLRREGPLAFFKGMLTPIVSMSAVNGTIFSCYGAALRAQGYPSSGAEAGSAPLGAVWVAGMFAGFVQTFIAAPSFGGAKEGYVFKSGPRGLGYYRDGQTGSATKHARTETKVVEADADLDELD